LTASKAKVSLHGIRTATPVWLTQEGVPSAATASDYSLKTGGFYRNALGQLALPLR
jgi:hypothetical protein